MFDGVRVEPTLDSLQAAADFALDAGVDGFVSIGGGSTIDTAKVAALIASEPAPVMDYVNAPIGAARKPSGPLLPHLAIPTTSGRAARRRRSPCSTSPSGGSRPASRTATCARRRRSSTRCWPRTLPAEVVRVRGAGRRLPRGGVLPVAALLVARAAGVAR